VFISGGITHASFGGIGIGYFLGINPLLGAALFAILAACGIRFFADNGKLREDSSIAVWWSAGMAVGIIFIYLTPGYVPDLMNYLFGSILAVSTTEIKLMFILAAILLLCFTFLYRKILYIAFNEEFAKAIGLPVNRINYLLMLLIALTIVLNIRIVGIILILSLLTIPQAMANLLTGDLKRMIALSVLFSLVGSLAGLFISFYADIPSGATIIFTLIAFYLALKYSVAVGKRRKR
jgi:zinc transport system permease protein